MKTIKYSSTIKKTPYKYTISKKVARLLLDGLNKNEVFTKCIDNNYIEVDSEERRKEIVRVVYERLLELDNYLLNEFYHGDINTSKFILVYAIAKCDQLFFDFMFEVYRNALLSEGKYISIDDMELFFASKKETSDTVAKWGHFTFEQLSKGYRNIIVDSGLGHRKKNIITVDKALVHPAVQEHIALIHDKQYIQALLGED